MWIKIAGQLSDVTFQLVTPTSSHLLIAGDQLALVDSGISANFPTLGESLDEYLGPRPLDMLLLTHAHFDHLGGLPYLRDKYPDLMVCGSPLCAELLADKELRSSFYQKNLQYAAAFEVEMPLSESEWCEKLVIDQVVADGDLIQLGDDVEVKVVGCPGHAEELVGYYVAEDCVLAAAEAVGGYSGRERVTPCFTASYHSFLATIDRLAGLQINVLVLPHYGALTGELISRFLTDLRTEAERLLVHFKERISQGELQEEIVSSIVPEWVSENRCPEGPFLPELSESLSAMVRVAAATEVPKADAEPTRSS